MATTSFQGDRKLANEDCRTCKRRRITCDRAIPSCWKCSTRSLECPGYGPKLKWISFEASSMAKMTSQRSCKMIQVSLNESSVFRADHRFDLDAPSTTEAVFGPMSHIMGKDAHQLTQNPTYSIGIFEDPVARSLIHHYNQVIAPQMVWTDFAENPFRRLILPLAAQSPALLMSIFTVAAGDIWHRNQNLDTQQMWAKYQHRTLTLLTRHFQAANDGDQEIIKSFEVESNAASILAAFLLASLGLRLGKYKDWRLHLRAAASLIEHWNSFQPSSATCQNTVREFLVQEVYASKVWESVTTFQPLEAFRGEASTVSDNAPFIQYIRIIQKIADLERHRAETGFPAQDEPSLSRLQDLLEEARQRTRNCGKSFTFHSGAARTAFERVADLFHHAGILYGFQVLGADTSSNHLISSSRKFLFTNLREIAIADSIAQDLAWPVFIAGTECCGDKEIQTLVETRMEEIIRLSGPLDRPRLLDFLKCLWNLHVQQMETSWIGLARSWALDGKPILII